MTAAGPARRFRATGASEPSRRRRHRRRQRRRLPRRQEATPHRRPPRRRPRRVRCSMSPRSSGCPEPWDHVDPPAAATRTGPCSGAPFPAPDGDAPPARGEEVAPPGSPVPAGGHDLPYLSLIPRDQHHLAIGRREHHSIVGAIHGRPADTELAGSEPRPGDEETSLNRRSGPDLPDTPPEDLGAVAARRRAVLAVRAHRGNPTGAPISSVSERGLEPLRPIRAPGPQPGASAYSATPT